MNTSFPTLWDFTQARLDILKQLRDAGVQQEIELPQIVAVGVQGVGKSSVMEAISTLKLPRGAGTVTRCPMEFRLEHAADSRSLSVAITLQSHGGIVEFKSNLSDLDEFRDAIIDAQKSIINRNSADAATPGEGARTFSEDCVSVHARGPKLPDLHFYDIPGVIENVRDGQNPDQIDLIKRLVRKYVAKPNCIVLLIISCDYDLEVQGSVAQLIFTDPEINCKSRTVGVLTKVDKISWERQQSWLETFENKTRKVDNGWFAVKLPEDPDVSWEDARTKERAFFRDSEPWKSIHGEGRARLGSEQLSRCIDKLWCILRFPAISRDIMNKIEAALETENSDSETGTFVIYLPQNYERPEQSAFIPNDLTCSPTNLSLGGCLVSVHEPARAASWIEHNWDNPLLISIRDSTCGGPLAWMLSPAEPALAIFGSFADPNAVDMANSLANLSGFPVVIRASGDNPALTLTQANGSVHFGDTENNHQTNGSDDEAESADPRGTQSGDGGRAPPESTGSDGQELNKTEHEQLHGPTELDAGGDDGGGDGGGGGPTNLDRWESPLHRTRIGLGLKPDPVHTYEVAIGCTYKFIINRETEIPIDLDDLTRPLSRPEVVCLVDFKIETRPRESQVDRSYASIGFVVHRAKSIVERQFLPRGFDLPDQLYKRGQHRQILRGIKAALGFAQSSLLATATFSYNRNSDDTLEATDSKVMPRCRVNYEPGNRRHTDKLDNKSYSSYNIAYEPQSNPLGIEGSNSPPLDVKVGMGINLYPAGSEKPLPQMSFINRNQILIWVSDPTSKASIRGILVLISSHLDNIRTEEKLVIHEEEEIDLGPVLSTVTQRKVQRDGPGTVALSIAQVEKDGASASTFGAAVPALFAKIGQRSPPGPLAYIPAHEYLARGWDVNNNEWRSVLWPALDKHFRAAALERTPPVLNIQSPSKKAHQTAGIIVQAH